MTFLGEPLPKLSELLAQPKATEPESEQESDDE